MNYLLFLNSKLAGNLKFNSFFLVFCFTLMRKSPDCVGRLGQFAGQVQVGGVHLESGLLPVQFGQKFGHDDPLSRLDARSRSPLQSEHVQKASFQRFRPLADITCHLFHWIHIRIYFIFSMKIGKLAQKM